MGKNYWRETFGVKVRSEILSLLVKIFFFDPSGAMCRGDTLQSAECHLPALLLQSATPALRIRFGALRQWCVKFLPRISYPFWGSHTRKLRISLFARCATKWFFWPACDQNLEFGPFEVRPCVKFSKLLPGEISDLYASGPDSFPPGFFTPFWRATTRYYESVFLTTVRPNSAFDRHATKIYVLSFWPLCDQERPQKSATNGGLVT